MKCILETNRLILRELYIIDASLFYQLNLNPKNIQYTGDKPFNSIEDAKIFLENYKDYVNNGYGRWACITKDTNTFIGWCGLKYDKTQNETDIGFRFFEEYWNKGFATESAAACLNYGFDKLALSRIVGRAMVENKASIKVLEKIGLSFEKNILLDEKPAVLYAINK